MESNLYNSVFFFTLLKVVLCIACFVFLVRERKRFYFVENVETINPEPIENGLLSKEDEAVREVAAQVVDDVVKKASAVARERTACNQAQSKGCSLQRLPTIQIDTVSSLPPSPEDWSPPEESDEGPVDDSEIQLELDEQESGPSEEELREDLKSIIEELTAEAMVLAEKKLQVSCDPSEEPEPSEVETLPTTEQPEQEADDSEIRAAAEKVVEEVISKATETVEERLQSAIAGLSFPIAFDDAPEDVKEAATAFVKEIVGKAIAMAEEKSVPTVPFNFEDPDMMKTNGPWYIRAREAFIRLLRTACFCTPRRADS